MASVYLDIAHEVGSREFELPLQKLGLPARVRFLPCADFAFYGNGPTGVVRVGVERKTVDEMQGAASYHRFKSRQLPKMLKRYQFRFLVIEGRTRVRPRSGLMLEGRDIVSHRGQDLTIWHESGWGHGETFERWIKKQLTLRLKSTINILPSGNKEETCFILHALYRWFQKDWDAHTSAYGLDTATDVDEVLIDSRTWKRDMLAKIPGVGWKRSKRVANYFHSVHEAITATESDWQRALGFKQGLAVARNIVRVIHDTKDQHDAKGV